jgi:hypothetical protein
MHRKTLAGFALVMFLYGTTLLGQEMKEMGKSPELDRMKTLAGSWKGVDPEGKPINVSYKLVSEGTAVMEALGPVSHAESMVTMYHLDHGKLMLTHYCSMGNQPRLQLDRGKSSDSTFVFTFLDATNMKSLDEAHIHGLTIIFRDKRHFAQEWISRENGKERSETFTYERVE